jgi:serine/threonine protein kinase
MEEDERRVGQVVGSYRILDRLGSGSFATVYRAEHKATGTEVALKAIPKSSISDLRSYELLQREINLMKSMDHPFVALFYEVVESDDDYFLVMELVDGGSLLTYINNQQSHSERTARRLFYQMVSVLDYLHNDRHIAHRDIKAENVLLDRNLNIRVVDFGLARAFTPSKPFLHTSCGSPAYIAPEVIQERPYTAAADIWSAGILLYGIVTGRLPFYDANIAVMLGNILKLDPEIPAGVSPMCRQLLIRCLAKDPRGRITLDEIRGHPWIAEYENPRLADDDADAIRRLHVMNVDALDPDVMSEMRVAGYDSGGLLMDVQAGKITGRTALYKMLRRMRSIDEIQQWQQQRAARAEAFVSERRIPMAERGALARSCESALQRRMRKGLLKKPGAGAKVNARPIIRVVKRSESPVPGSRLPDLTIR